MQTLSQYYRIPDCLAAQNITIADLSMDEPGFFQYGATNVCYGRSQAGVAATLAGAAQFDASQAIEHIGSKLVLPFRFTEVIDNLRGERYRQEVVPGKEVFAASEPIRKFYYLIREFLPVKVRRQLQKFYFRDWKELQFPHWPIDFTVDNLHEEFLRLSMQATNLTRVPFIWFWPEGASNCLMMTHDVETSAGRDFTSQLMDLDEKYGIKASYQVIPEKRYDVPEEYVTEIRERGFEFNVHDLNHDGNLYRERKEFERRAARINGYVKKFQTRGFRAGAMYRNQDWYDVFEFSYDMSVPNVAHLEPLRGGCCTVMPYFVGKILELPLTTAQDYSLFHILNDYSIDIWKHQLNLLRERFGLMSFITHPDYLIDRRARKVYEHLLDHLRQLTKRENIWSALPCEIDYWWRARSEMKLVQHEDEWKIVGPEKERARLAYAVLDGNKVRYELAELSAGAKVPH